MPKARVVDESHTRGNVPSPAKTREARDSAGLTQEQAAALIGKPRLWWIRRETGASAWDAHDWAYWLHVAGIERIPFRRSR